MVNDLEGQAKAILSGCIEMTYFMRGGIQYEDFMELSPMERKLISAFLDKRLEAEGKRLNPVY